MEANENQLIRQAQSGDESAFARLVTRYDRRILQIAHAILNDLSESQDVYQETFIRAFQHLPSFRFECGFGTWLTRIAINRARSRLRRQRVRQFLALDEGTTASERTTPEESLQQQMLREAVARLPGRCKTVVILKYFQGYKIKEIAEILQCREGTVKNYLFRAVEKLRASFL